MFFVFKLLFGFLIRKIIPITNGTNTIGQITAAIAAIKLNNTKIIEVPPMYSGRVKSGSSYEKSSRIPPSIVYSKTFAKKAHVFLE